LPLPLDVHHERNDGGANEHQPQPYCPKALRCGMGDDGVGSLVVVVVLFTG